jgi:hypothetical protein
VGSKIRVIFSAFGSEEAMFSPRVLGEQHCVAIARDYALCRITERFIVLHVVSERHYHDVSRPDHAHCNAGQPLMIGSVGSTPSAQLLAAVSVPADVKADTPGLWPVQDDIHEHLDMGMIGHIHVEGPGEVAAAGHQHLRKMLRA